MSISFLYLHPDIEGYDLHRLSKALEKYSSILKNSNTGMLNYSLNGSVEAQCIFPTLNAVEAFKEL